jgi:outer membrane lipoprotein carrier protein
LSAPGFHHCERLQHRGLRRSVGLAASLLVLLLAGTSSAVATADGLQEIIDAQREIRSMQASFSQTKVLSLFDDTIESSGTLVIDKPDFYRWAYDRPERKIFYVDGMKTGTLEPDTGERDEVELDSRIGLATIIRSVTSIITGNLEQTTELDYEITKNPSKGGVRSYTFRPRSDELQPLFDQITIRFDNKTKLAQDLEIEEPNGDITRMTFTDWRTNVAVDRSDVAR